MKNTNNEPSNLSVLIIEDNQGDFILIEDFLLEKFKGVIINHCVDCKTALDYLQRAEETPTIILLDLHLPDMSGIKLIEKILSHTTYIPIIIMTGYSDLPLAIKSLQLGVNDFLVKDEINPTLLHKSIEFAINRKKYISQIEIQNEKLKNIAWTQSHLVRGPLSRILGIINLIENQKSKISDMPLLLEKLKISSNELDDVIRKIVNESQEYS